jgi:hypothetical protein
MYHDAEHSRGGHRQSSWEDSPEHSPAVRCESWEPRRRPRVTFAAGRGWDGGAPRGDSAVRPAPRRGAPGPLREGRSVGPVRSGRGGALDPRQPCRTPSIPVAPLVTGRGPDGSSSGRWQGRIAPRARRSPMEVVGFQTLPTAMMMVRLSLATADAGLGRSGPKGHRGRASAATNPAPSRPRRKGYRRDVDWLWVVLLVVAVIVVLVVLFVAMRARRRGGGVIAARPRRQGRRQ